MQTQVETAATLRTSSGGAARAVRATTRWEQVAGGAGVVFVATQLSGAALLGTQPGVNARPSVVREYLLAHDGQVLASAMLSALGAFFFLWFIRYSRTTLGRALTPGWVP